MTLPLLPRVTLAGHIPAVSGEKVSKEARGENEKNVGFAGGNAAVEQGIVIWENGRETAEVG